MSLKPQPSGSMKRKHKKDKEAREAQLLQKLPTISSFFKTVDAILHNLLLLLSTCSNVLP